MAGAIAQQRHIIVKWAFWLFVLLILAVVLNVATSGEAAHILVAVVGGLWKFGVALKDVVMDAIHEWKATH